MGGGVEADERQVHIREISDADVRVNALKIVKDGLHLSDEGFLVHELLLCSVRVTTRGGGRELRCVSGVRTEPHKKWGCSAEAKTMKGSCSGSVASGA